MKTFKIVRMYQDSRCANETLVKGLTLEQAQAHCNDPETSWKTATSDAARERTRQCGPWFDGYYAE